MPSIKPDWYCIVNPHAGSGKTMSEWAVAEKRLTSLSVPYKTSLTNYKFHAEKLAFEAASHGYRKILAVGGDGSVHEVLNGILRFCAEQGTAPEEFTLSVIPIGSGNDWIKSLGVPHDTAAVVDLLAAGAFARQDVVRVETSRGISYMANIGGVGFDSHVCDRVNALKDSGKRGRTIYLGALLYTIFHTQSFATRLVADGKVVFEGEAYSVAFGNGRYSGGGMRQVPLSEIDDGLLDYMVVPKAPLSRILTQLPRLYNGTVNESGLLLSGRCRVLEMTGENIVEMDGEIVGSLPLRISMTGRQLGVLVGNL
ncbi:MAG: hypothetical protein IJ654_04955 [Bacteroidales bacterium]|nr:hypothetical protein [Bacteroidales bacterium]